MVITPQTRVFLELNASTTEASSTDASSLGKALGLARGFTQKVLARLGAASQRWQRHVPMASTIDQIVARSIVNPDKSGLTRDQ
jgi:hypothetical protein